MRVCIAAVVAAWSLVACQQDQQSPAGLKSEVRDSAGGGNGIRSHVLIGVQGVP
jgi:hypothetical protein